MYTTRGIIKKAYRSMIEMLTKEGLLNEFRIIKRKFSKQLKATIYIYEDACPEFYEGPLYVAEICKDLPDGLLNTIVQPSLDLLLRELEDYLNE